MANHAGVAAPEPDVVQGATGGDRFLAHHFDDAAQQAATAKLGMWVFLVTEILLFSGLFCVYAIYRGNHPELFRYGAQFLDVGWGALNTVVLLFSSLTMALAVRAAQVSDRRGVVLYLLLTLLCGCDFLGVKWIEYRHKFHEHLVGGATFYEAPGPGAPPAPVTVLASLGAAAAAPPATVAPDAAIGRKLFMGTCAACHGPDGAGAAIKGKSLVTSKFVAERDDGALLSYVKTGRSADDPLNTTGLTMLPRGGNPSLKDQDLRHLVAFIRLLQQRGAGAAAPAAPAVAEPAAPPAVETGALAVAAAPLPAAAAAVPPNAHLFFGIYFLMTGLHGVHVLVGMGVMAWLLRRALKGHFGAAYFTPVEMGGLYWHLVDLIWIYLFPLLYLIH